MLILLAQFGLSQTQQILRSQLSDLGIEFHMPAEQKFQILEKENPLFHEYLFAIASKKEKIEIRIEVSSPQNLTNYFPNIQNGTRLAHCAANFEDSIISLFSLGSEELAFSRADWGTQAIFYPKKEFSSARYCQLISFYKEEGPQVFIYCLFDDPENQYLEQTFNLLSYK